MSSEKKVQASGVELRPPIREDEAFLYQLYCSTREEEVSAWGLEAAQLDMLLKLQFTAQRRHFDIAFPESDVKIIVVGGEPAGRIITFRSELEIRLVDIALLPDYRNGGIGARLIGELLDEGARTIRPVTLHVEKHNRAARLYLRLGFSVTGDIGTHYKMEWRPK